MTHIDSSDGAAVLVRAADAEVVGFPLRVRLLAEYRALRAGRVEAIRSGLA